MSIRLYGAQYNANDVRHLQGQDMLIRKCATCYSEVSREELEYSRLAPVALEQVVSLVSDLPEREGLNRGRKVGTV